MSAKKHITLTWTGLSASIKDKTLLHKCQGYCKPGEMLAIMGPSGAGKTTLLSLISQKADPKLLVKGIVLNP
jgi:ABC-type multidrug transport system ATPase subunit